MNSGQFQRELLPPARSFYENELRKLTRPSRGWARGNCPFHESKSRSSFSVNLDSGGFYCFGCEVKGGDILDFVKLRDKVDFKRAAQILGAWRDQEMSPAEKEQIGRKRQTNPPGGKLCAVLN
jgi:DNA primase